jgi:hypothetical protein
MHGRAARSSYAVNPESAGQKGGRAIRGVTGLVFAVAFVLATVGFSRIEPFVVIGSLFQGLAVAAGSAGPPCLLCTC